MIWNETTLGEFVSMKRGYDLPEDQRITGTIPIIGSAGVTGYHNEAKVVGGGITIGRSGNSFGQVFFCKEDFWPHNAAMYINDYKGHDKKFVYYLLKNIDFSNYNSGSAQPSLNRNFIYPIKIKIPTLEIERKIAFILSAYDDLIENNLKRIKLLEEAAQNIYKEWFVNFRVSGEGSEINEMSELPRGWSTKKLEEVTSFISRGISPTYVSDDGIKVLNQKCIRNQRISISEARLTEKSVKISTEKMVKEYDVLINSTGAGTLGRVAQIIEVDEPMTVDTHVTIVRADTEKITPLLLGSQLKATEKFIESLGKGATNQTELSRTDLKQLVQIIIPPKNIQDEFEKISTPFLKQISNLLKQNKKLQEARDILLPRLMNQTIEL